MTKSTKCESPTPETKRAMATKAGIDSGVIDLYQAFVVIYALQNQISALIEEVSRLEVKLVEECGTLATSINCIEERLDNWYSNSHN